MTDQFERSQQVADAFDALKAVLADSLPMDGKDARIETLAGAIYNLAHADILASIHGSARRDAPIATALGDEARHLGAFTGMAVTDDMVKVAAAGVQRLFITRDTDQPMPSFDELARAALVAVRGKWDDARDGRF